MRDMSTDEQKGLSTAEAAALQAVKNMQWLRQEPQAEGSGEPPATAYQSDVLSDPVALELILAQMLKGETPRPITPHPEEDRAGRDDSAAEADALLSDIEQLPGEVKALLTAEINELKAARRNGNVPKDLVDRIRQAVEQAEAAAEAKAETPEQTVQRLWGEVKRLNEESTKIFDELDGYTTPEEKKKRKELLEAIEKEQDEKKKLELQKELNKLDKTVADRVHTQAEPGSADHHKADDLDRKTREREQNLDDLQFTAKKQSIKPKAGETKDAGNTSTLQPTPANKTVNTDGAAVKAGQEARIAISPAIVSSFGGFGSDSESIAAPTQIKDAKSVVSPTLAASFSGFDAPESAPAQTPGAKPKAPITRQT